MVSGVRVSNEADKVTPAEAENKRYRKYTIQAEMTESEAIQSIVNQVVIQAAT